MTDLVPLGLTFALALCRVGGLLVAMPWLSSDVVPGSVRVIAAVVLGAVVTLSVGPYAGEPTLAQLFGAGVRELAFGLGSGLLVRILLSAVEIAGQVVALQLSLGFAGTLDPALREESGAMTQIWASAAGIVFFAAGGLEGVLGVLVGGFSVLPPGHALWPDADLLVRSVGLAFSQALVIAMPVFAGAVAGQVALALVARAEPELNVFGLAFGLLTLIGLLLFADTLTGMLDVGRELARTAPQALLALTIPERLTP